MRMRICYKYTTGKEGKKEFEKSSEVLTPFQCACVFLKAYHKEKNVTKFKAVWFFLGVAVGDGGRIPSGFFSHLKIELS